MSEAPTGPGLTTRRGGRRLVAALALAALLVVLVICVPKCSPESAVGLYQGALDRIVLELVLREDGTFHWYLAPPPGADGARAPGSRVAQYSGEWRMLDGDVEMRYGTGGGANQEQGTRFAVLAGDTLKTTYGMGAERVLLRRQSPRRQ